ncbi:CDP-diacylglycerol--serine O-phosphatidyltransferase [Porphyromonas macacae]|uniref:CDP-diacylglycerol--serine O-phosphatidyltransferase n=1 Tax=Porphyromonas macacae TaxID=28115 RepID=UPI0024AD5A24|nr:CDP-diacylglycerol--serine O-phosphatidyltransferase [Porphyromonas macacae]
MNIRKNIPNAITSLNLLSGALSLVFSLYLKQLHIAVWFIVAAAVFDFFDGLVARMLHVVSPIGKELDSLADVISFGVAPAALIFAAFAPAANSSSELLLCLPIFITSVFAGIRLAKFNVDTRQATSFLGLPVPSNALFWIGFFALGTSYGYFSRPVAVDIPVFLMCFFTILMSCLMVSEVPMFSLKVKNFGWRGNERQYLLILSALAFFLLFGWGGFAPTIIVYVFLSLLKA